MGTQSTGNGRRESYAHLPMPRMTNTYMLAGQSDPGEIIASVKKAFMPLIWWWSGRYYFRQILFSASEAYLIENGKITAPVRGATLTGNGSEVLQRVSMVGNDLKLDSALAFAEKKDRVCLWVLGSLR